MVSASTTISPSQETPASNHLHQQKQKARGQCYEGLTDRANHSDEQGDDSKHPNQTAFRRAERIFRKARNPAALCLGLTSDMLTPVPLDVELTAVLDAAFGIQSPGSRSAGPKTIGYALRGTGFLFIPAALSPNLQARFINRAFTHYTSPRTNLHTFYSLPAPFWTLYQSRYPDPIPLRAAPADPGANTHFPTLRPATLDALLKKLRWATLGVHFDWDRRAYHEETGNGQDTGFPEDLQRLTKEIVRATESFTGYEGRRWRAESGVVNFYKKGDGMLAHVDKSEENMEAPLVSISLAHSCVYLLGTESKEDQPWPFYLQSGDIILMSGPSRAFYHGVPRIIEHSWHAKLMNHENKHGEAEGTVERDVADLIHRLGIRVNINARQVFRSGESVS